jgi:hypothetical protein
VLLRCTTKLLEMLGRRPGDLVAAEPGADDWYGDLFWIERRKCLLLMHSGTMLAVFIPDVRKADLVPLGAAIVGHIEDGLADEGLPRATLGVLDPTSVSLAKTASRSLLGCMREDRHFLQRAVAIGGGLARCDVRHINHQLRRTLHLPAGRGAVWPVDEARRRAQSASLLGS